MPDTSHADVIDLQLKLQTDTTGHFICHLQHLILYGIVRFDAYGMLAG